MREIKFRAWDIAEKKMIDDVEKLILSSNIGWTICATCGLHIGANIQSKYILMQFTGLKDKNGKEMDWWENDLLRKGSDHSCAPIGRIVYNPQKAQWVIVGKSGGEFCGLLTAYLNDWKKIGNVHQNPELLEKEK